MKYNGTNLKEVLEEHKRWININKAEGWTENGRADLHGADLRGAYLSGADLRGADLRGVNLSGADLHGADLRGADLHRADLRKAYLHGADLRKACLHRAYLIEADLSGADLSGANLSGAYLIEADLSGAKNVPYIPMACPDVGSFIGWKVCNSDIGKVIVKLLIPEDAKRSSGTGRKCRCDKAIVMEIQNKDGTKSDTDVAYSQYYNAQHFAYKVGETVVPEEPFDDNRWKECASGIHFFINRQEAAEY